MAFDFENLKIDVLAFIPYASSRYMSIVKSNIFTEKFPLSCILFKLFSSISKMYNVMHNGYGLVLKFPYRSDSWKVSQGH